MPMLMLLLRLTNMIQIYHMSQVHHEIQNANTSPKYTVMTMMLMLMLMLMRMLMPTLMLMLMMMTLSRCGMHVVNEAVASLKFLSV